MSAPKTIGDHLVPRAAAQPGESRPWTEAQPDFGRPGVYRPEALRRLYELAAELAGGPGAIGLGACAHGNDHSEEAFRQTLSVAGIDPARIDAEVAIVRTRAERTCAACAEAEHTGGRWTAHACSKVEDATVTSAPRAPAADIKPHWPVRIDFVGEPGPLVGKVVVGFHRGRDGVTTLTFGAAEDATVTSTPCAPSDLLRDLRDIGTGKIVHAWSGCCPNVSSEGIETADDRADPLDACPACDVLRRADALLAGDYPPSPGAVEPVTCVLAPGVVATVLYGSIDGPVLVASVIMEPGAALRPEIHPAHEETMVWLTRRGTFVVPAGMEHSASNTSTEPAEYISIMRRVADATKEG